jgi:hypothetical protein
MNIGYLPMTLPAHLINSYVPLLVLEELDPTHQNTDTKKEISSLTGEYTAVALTQCMSTLLPGYESVPPRPNLIELLLMLGFPQSSIPRLEASLKDGSRVSIKFMLEETTPGAGVRVLKWSVLGQSFRPTPYFIQGDFLLPVSSESTSGET